MSRMKKNYGFTLIELVVTLVIVSFLVAVTVMTIAGTMPRYKLSRGIRTVFNNMLMAKSKAVTLNKTYRMNVLSSTTFKLQYDDAGSWIDDGGIQTLPPDIEISTDPMDYVANCGANLEFTSRGILNVLGGAQTDPYIILRNTLTNQEKSITVNIGGNLRVN